jgi:hypothetical protein
MESAPRSGANPGSVSVSRSARCGSTPATRRALSRPCAPSLKRAGKRFGARPAPSPARATSSGAGNAVRPSLQREPNPERMGAAGEPGRPCPRQLALEPAAARGPQPARCTAWLTALGFPRFCPSDGRQHRTIPCHPLSHCHRDGDGARTRRMVRVSFLPCLREPPPGFEPGTYGLRNRCSTAELQGHNRCQAA